MYWLSKAEADRICSERMLGVGVIGFCSLLSSSWVMQRVLVGDSGSSIWMMCSLVSNWAGGVRRLSLIGSNSGVLGSDGS